MAIACLLLAAEPVEAREAAPRIDIAATSLDRAIAELAQKAGVSIGLEGALPALRVRPLHARIGVAEALDRLLAGSGYVARQVGPTAWRIVAAPVARAPVPRREVASVPPPEVISTQPIVVTATKRKLRLSELPLSVAVVVLDDSAQPAAVRGTSAALAQVEGAALTDLGSGRNRMFFHGVADSPFNGENQATVAVLLDDARITWSAPDPDVRLVDVARVEVLKGPQGSLYGTGALGGIYRVVTNKPDLANASVSIEVGAATVAHGAAGANGSAVLNLPLIEDRAALRVVGYFADEPGWIETGPRDNTNHTHVGGGRAALRVDLGRGATLDLQGLVQRLGLRDSQYTYADDSLRRPAQVREPHDNDLTLVAAKATVPLGPLELSATTSLTWHDFIETFDATQGAAGFGVTAPTRFDDARDYRVWDSELRVSGQLGRIGVLAGVAHVEADEIALRTLESAISASPTAVGSTSRISRDSALFGEASLPLGGRITVTAGARLFASSIADRRAGPGLTGERDQDRAGLTPSFALAWRPGDAMLVWLRYASAIRQGGLGVAGPGKSGKFEGDELATIEAGLRLRTWRGGSLELGAHYSKWDNLQSDVLLSTGLFATENAGAARITGVEASLRQPLAQGWTIETGVTFESALLSRNALGIALDDRRLPVVPRYTLRGEVTKGFRLGAVAGSIKASARWVGPARLSFDPALDREMGKILETAVEARFDLQGWSLALRADNLFDRRENSFAFGNPFRLPDSPQFTPQRPRAVSISVGRKF